jgi:hypothetical protein
MVITPSPVPIQTRSSEHAMTPLLRRLCGNQHTRLEMPSVPRLDIHPSLEASVKCSLLPL